MPAPYTIALRGENPSGDAPGGRIQGGPGGAPARIAASGLHDERPGPTIGLMKAAPILSFESISHVFPGMAGHEPVRVLDDVSFAVPPGSFTALIGPSGCGKSTLIQVAAGLLAPARGLARQNGETISGVNRRVGFVPQLPQLMPWKTLRENVELPLQLRGVAADERRQRVADAIAAVGLAGFEEHWPYSLSGGMQKRASIARTLVYEPDVILMDEPFGALDAQTRMVMQRDLQELVKVRGTSVLLVTHDISEAVLLADEVVVMSRRPARILARIAIGMARPRDVFEPLRNDGFGEAYERVWSAFRSEVVGSSPDQERRLAS